MRPSPVVGQTGKGHKVLSDETRLYGRSKKRTVRYEFRGMGPNSWMASVIGPFDSLLYGACGFGGTKARAEKELRRNLADNYSYLGRMILSVTDDADSVGDVDTTLWDDRRDKGPITKILAHVRG